MNTDTLLDHLVVLAVAALLLGPTLYGIVHDRRIDRQLSAAQQRAQIVRHGHRRQQTRPGASRVALRHASCE
ncbi:hypothetical protein AB0D94_15750 [Streptomyces sp. NPDC048255]|uniref:hypothetical protein n=1 Tax=Streptomyces sp. NPDC048255 TaxID=3154713 RepID=UPI0033EB5811